MAVNDIYEVSMLYSIKGEKCANVLHLREDVDPGSNNEQTVANAVKTGIWDGSLKLAVSNDVKLQVVRARRIDPTAGGPVDVVVNADGSVKSLHRSEVRSRYIYKHEMALLLRIAGYARWEIYGGFDRCPLERENDAMVIMAWNE